MTPLDKLGQLQQIRAINATKAIIAKGAIVELVQVLGYKNILRNKVVNKLTKEATLKPIFNSKTTSFAFLSIKINKLKT